MGLLCKQIKKDNFRNLSTGTLQISIKNPRFKRDPTFEYKGVKVLYVAYQNLFKKKKKKNIKKNIR